MRKLFVLLVVGLLAIAAAPAVAQDGVALVCTVEDVQAAMVEAGALLNEAQTLLGAGNIEGALASMNEAARVQMLIDSECRGLIFSGVGDYEDVARITLEPGTYILEYEFTGAADVYSASLDLRFSGIDNDSAPVGFFESVDTGETASGRQVMNVRDYMARELLIEIEADDVDQWRVAILRP